MEAELQIQCCLLALKMEKGPQTKECRQPLEEAGKEGNMVLGASKRNQPWGHLNSSPVRLILDFRSKCVLFKSLYFGNLIQQQEETNIHPSVTQWNIMVQGEW